MTTKSVVFIDRDGTISIDHGYTVSPVGLQLFARAADGVALLKRAGFLVVIVSNQSAIGRGLARFSDVDATNAEVLRLLREENADASIDDVLYCPHRPEDACSCRKPLTGMLDAWPYRNEMFKANSFVVGDKLSDLEFGKNLGLPACNCILVKTGEGMAAMAKLRAIGPLGYSVSEDLFEACEYIVAENEAAGKTL